MDKAEAAELTGQRKVRRSLTGILRLDNGVVISRTRLRVYL